ncbi:MAG: dihydrodipicolinate synthase family protein [Terracidiphilus sp.]
MKWCGVMPAMTTCLDDHLQVDAGFMTAHARWMLDNGCSGIVSLGSLGQAATLTFAEKEAILRNMVAAAGDRAPVVAAISALSTDEAVALAKSAERAGSSGLMVLPPYVYRGDWREMKAYVTAVFRATPLSCMLYNNPVAYGTDFLPTQIAELAHEHENFAAVKESSSDMRRVTGIRALLGERLQVFVGVDDAIVEGISAGAVGWIAGLVNAFPAESVALFNLAIAGKREEAFALYSWFLPLLRMDTVPKFVQLIHQVQQETRTGNVRVRPPRLEVTGTELEEAREVVAEALRHPPSVRSTAFSRS